MQSVFTTGYIYNCISDNRIVLGLNRINEKTKRYSLGMRQRLGVAQALLHRPPLLLLDEPVSGLDPAATADFYEVICKINDAGTAVIMVSHDVHSSLSVAKHVLHIGAKTTIFFGTPHKYEIEQMGGM